MLLVVLRWANDFGPNLYAYVGNGPLSRIDPLGLAALVIATRDAVTNESIAAGGAFSLTVRDAAGASLTKEIRSFRTFPLPTSSELVDFGTGARGFGRVRIDIPDLPCEAKTLDFSFTSIPVNLYRYKISALRVSDIPVDPGPTQLRVILHNRRGDGGGGGGGGSSVGASQRALPTAVGQSVAALSGGEAAALLLTPAALAGTTLLGRSLIAAAVLIPSVADDAILLPAGGYLLGLPGN